MQTTEHSGDGYIQLPDGKRFADVSYRITIGEADGANETSFVEIHNIDFTSKTPQLPWGWLYEHPDLMLFTEQGIIKLAVEVDTNSGEDGSSEVPRFTVLGTEGVFNK